MRISSSTLFESSVAALNRQQARLLHTQQQVASGRRILTASDDPVAAVRALDVSQSDSMNTQYSTNRDAARHSLTMAESTLQAVTNLLLEVRTATIGVGNGSLTDSNRQTIARDFSGRLQELIGLANTTDGSGNYLFSGFQTSMSPFADTAAGVAYFGDDGQRLVQVSASRQMDSGNSGADVFMRVKNGNGSFVTQAAATNTGSGIISMGSSPNLALLTGDSYSLSFSVAGSVTTYDITNTTTGGVVSVGNPYFSGQAINFNGIQFDIKGIPANGDVFTVTPSVNESIFKTISDLINALNTPVAGANLSNSLIRGISNLDNALNNVLNARSSLGLRLNEIDSLQFAGEDLGLQFKQTLSQLQDVDYSKAISDLTQQQMTLEAAQKSFARVAGLSLFDYI